MRDIEHLNAAATTRVGGCLSFYFPFKLLKDGMFLRGAESLLSSYINIYI